MARELEYLEQAVIEAEAAARWYAERSATVAARFSIELDEAEAAILERPEASPPGEEGTVAICSAVSPSVWSIVSRHRGCLSSPLHMVAGALAIGSIAPHGLPNMPLQPTSGALGTNWSDEL